MQFNTAISAMMEYINQFVGEMPRSCYEALLQCLNPFAPHLSEEMWEKLGHTEMLVFHSWPIADESKLARTSQNISVSVNGKHRGAIQVSVAATENEIADAAKIVAGKVFDGRNHKNNFRTWENDKLCNQGLKMKKSICCLFFAVCCLLLWFLPRCIQMNYLQKLATSGLHRFLAQMELTCVMHCAQDWVIETKSLPQNIH